MNDNEKLDFEKIYLREHERAQLLEAQLNSLRDAARKMLSEYQAFQWLSSDAVNLLQDELLKE